MRPLTEEETKTLLEKLSKYIGKNIVQLTEGECCLRLHKDRVYYVSESIMNKAVCIGRNELCSLGMCFGKFSKSGKFRIHITALDFIAQYAIFKVWLKPKGEMSFLYGNHVLRAHVAKMSDQVPENIGVVVFNSQDVPLGFGVSTKTSEVRKIDPTAILVLHQSDVGEYIRSFEQ